METTHHHLKLTEAITVKLDTETKRELQALAEFEGLEPSVKLRQLAEGYIESRRRELTLLKEVFRDV